MTRAARLAAAGVPLHAYHRRPGVYMRGGVAECGAKSDQGAEFTTWSKYVTCPECRAVIQRRRAAAKATLAAITGGVS